MDNKTDLLKVGTWVLAVDPRWKGEIPAKLGRISEVSDYRGTGGSVYYRVIIKRSGMRGKGVTYGPDALTPITPEAK